MLETHYDNPNQLSNLRVSVTLETYYTKRLRMLWIGEWSPAATSILVPPNSLSHVTMGHCAPGCTTRWLDKEINVFAFLLHTHLAGCVYETTNTNGSVVEGGFSTRQEMCDALMYYYNRIPGMSFCLSEIKTEAYYNLLGIQNVTWDASRKDMAITSPPQFAGLTMQDYADNHIEWDIRMREEIQRYHKFEPHTVICPSAYPDPITEEEEEDLDNGGKILRYSGNGEISLISKHSGWREPSQNIDENDVRSGDVHISALPQGVTRYRRPPQCTSRSG
ncbi:DBH-like monooxygenase protein 1 [Orchesella cincta]|uniref:DBH-like monooxygenase protein 1 n=1 Tax=Orchesella cincta TaxID=48709 RepID=A0A1D2MJ96_ORCCI|nr:DBH-like monooxygenase protein 1 [Orchesella cincta]